MTAELRRGAFLAILGLLLGLGLVAGLFEGVDYWKHAAAPAPGTEAVSGAVGVLSPDTGTVEAPRGAADASRQAEPAPRVAAPATDPKALKFDIVRVEPNGESVVAGRAAPNTVVELLVDGKAVAKALADPNGQFALVPPALPAGNSEIALRSTDAEGRETRSADSVAVAVSASRKEKPLVALTSPDKPTVVLSQPDAPAATAQRKPDGAVGRQAGLGKDTVSGKDMPVEAGPGHGPSGKDVAPKNTPTKDPSAKIPAAKDSATKPAAKEAHAPVKVVSVDAQEGGRLFVTSQAPPGATVRLYLNDTLIAPGNVGTDGKVTFTIGRGVKPGAYTVRVDQVDPVTGKVRGRAEVPFTVPEPARVAAIAKPADKPAEAPAAKAAERPSVGAAASAKAEPPRAVPAETAAAPVAPAEPKPAAPVPSAPGARMPAAASPPRDAGATAGVFVPEVNTARIIRGDTLWQISRRTYGAGDRYTVIYDANQEQIRNPDLIYPGQIFVLPGEGKQSKADKNG